MRHQVCNVDLLRELAHRAADRLMSHGWKVWFWGDSIGLEGLLDASDLLADKQYETFVYGLLKAWIARRQPAREWDYTAAGVALLRSYERTLDPQVLRVAQEHGEWLATSFRQTEGGAYVRCEDPDFELPPEAAAIDPDGLVRSGMSYPMKPGACVFVDNMHFDGPFYSKLRQIAGDDRWSTLAAANILGSIHLLFDQTCNLFHHFWIERQARRNGIFWGRGQGWALLGLVNTLQYLDYQHPAYSIGLDVLRRQCRALSHLQDASGHWHTIVDDSGSYLEHSVAAFVIDGFSRAIMRKWIDDSYREIVTRAMMGLVNEVQEDGTLTGVSYETYPSLRPEHYKSMPKGAMVPWGQGPLLTAICSYVALVKTSM